jgi:hypothetical protein
MAATCTRFRVIWRPPDHHHTTTTHAMTVRAVQVTKKTFIAGSYVPATKDSPAIDTPSRWEMVDKGTALFHCFGSEYEEFENGVGNCTVAIVEWPDGTVGTVLPGEIRFLEPLTGVTAASL